MLTNYWDLFSIAEPKGLDAVKALYKEFFEEAKNDYEALTALVMVANHKCWEHHENPYAEKLCELYALLYEECYDYGLDHLKGEELQYFLNTLD